VLYSLIVHQHSLEHVASIFGFKENSKQVFHLCLPLFAGSFASALKIDVVYSSETLVSFSLD
jgi:hypothetical protein